MSVLRTHGPRLAAGAVVATLAVTGLTPLTAAEAAPADCATALAPFLATSDAQPGYTGHAVDHLGIGTADSTSRWDSRLVRSGLDSALTLDLVVAGRPLHITTATSSVTTRQARWTTVPTGLGTRRTRSGALVLLHKSAPLWFVDATPSTVDDVHSSGVWPSHDASLFLATASVLTGTAPGPDGSTVYSCGGAADEATFTVTAAGLVSQVTFEGTGSAARTSAHGLVGSVRRAAADLRSAARGGARTVAAPTDSITIDYTYARPSISVPSRSHVVLLQRYAMALEAVDLRASVHTAASIVALVTNQGRTATHKRVTAGEIQRNAAMIVTGLNAFQTIQYRVGKHPGSVWIAATNPFTGERVAYRVGIVAGKAKVTKVA